MKLVSSNENKLKEFKRLGLSELEIEKGRDIEEVDADAQTVVLYKALAAGENRVIEDTSLHVDGQNVGANIRWLLDDIASYNGLKAQWEVLLGVNNGKEIIIYQGLINGLITDKFKDQQLGFGFDAYFIPDGSLKTLFELEKEGNKDSFSARKKAVEAFKSDDFLSKTIINSIPAWEGNMQH